MAITACGVDRLQQSFLAKSFKMEAFLIAAEYKNYKFSESLISLFQICTAMKFSAI